MCTSRPNIEAFWQRHLVYNVPTTRTTITDVIVGIQYGKITIILIDDTNTKIKGSSSIRLWQNNTTNTDNATTKSSIGEG